VLAQHLEDGVCDKKLKTSSHEGISKEENELANYTWYW
jgi:hypothetical protein